MNESANFADGKAFHTLIARYLHYEEQIDSERMLTKANGRTGRADIFLWIKPDYSDAVVIESKWTDWDRLQSRGHCDLTCMRTGDKYGATWMERSRSNEE